MQRILYAETDRPENRWAFNQHVRKKVLLKRPHLGAVIPYDRDYLTHHLLSDLFESTEPEYGLNALYYPTGEVPVTARRRIEPVCTHTQCECHHATSVPVVAERIMQRCAELTGPQWVNRVGVDEDHRLSPAVDRHPRVECRIGDADHGIFMRALAHCGTDMDYQMTRRLNHFYAKSVSCRMQCGSMARHIPTMRRYVHLDLLHGAGLTVHAMTDCQVDITWSNSRRSARDSMANFHLLPSDNHSLTTALTRHVGRQLERKILRLGLF